jgi:hypothetical protein
MKNTTDNTETDNQAQPTKIKGTTMVRIGKKQKEDMIETMTYIHTVLCSQKYTYKNGITTTKNKFNPEIYDCLVAFGENDDLFTTFKTVMDAFEGKEVESLTTTISTLTTRLLSMSSLKLHTWNISTSSYDVSSLTDNERSKRVHNMAVQLQHALSNTIAVVSRKEIATLPVIITTVNKTVRGKVVQTLKKTIDFGAPTEVRKRKSVSKGLLYTYDSKKQSVHTNAKVVRLASKGGTDIYNVKQGKKKPKVVNGKKVFPVTATEQLLLDLQAPKSAVKFHPLVKAWTIDFIYNLLITTPNVTRTLRDIPRGVTKEEHKRTVLERAMLEATEMHNLIGDPRPFTFQHKRDLTMRLNNIFARFSMLGPQVHGKHFYVDTERRPITKDAMDYFKHQIVVLGTGVRYTPAKAKQLFDKTPNYYINKLLQEEVIEKPKPFDAKYITAVENLMIKESLTLEEGEERDNFLKEKAKEMIQLKVAKGIEYDEYVYATGFGKYKDDFYKKALLEAYYAGVMGMPTDFLMARDYTTGGLGFYGLEFGSVKMTALANLLDGGKMDEEGNYVSPLTVEEEEAFNAYEVFAGSLGYVKADGTLSYKQAKTVLMPMLHGAMYTATAQTMYDKGENQGLSVKALGEKIRFKLIEVFGIEFLNIGKINSWVKKHLLTPTTSQLTWKNWMGVQCASLFYEKSSEFAATSKVIDVETAELVDVSVNIVRAMPLRFEMKNGKHKILREEKSRNGKILEFEISDSGFMANAEHSIDPKPVVYMAQDKNLALKMSIFDNFLAQGNEHKGISRHTVRAQTDIYNTSPIKDALEQSIDNSGLTIKESDRLVFGGDITRAGYDNYIYYPKFKVDSDELCSNKAKFFLSILGKADACLQA